MASNTKLDRSSKNLLKKLKANYPHVKFATDATQLVCAFYPVGGNVRFAFAIMSPDEQKFRRKVGEMYALKRVLPDWADQATILPEGLFYDLLELASCNCY